MNLKLIIYLWIVSPNFESVSCRAIQFSKAIKGRCEHSTIRQADKAQRGLAFAGRRPTSPTKTVVPTDRIEDHRPIICESSPDNRCKIGAFEKKKG